LTDRRRFWRGGVVFDAIAVLLASRKIGRQRRSNHLRIHFLHKALALFRDLLGIGNVLGRSGGGQRRACRNTLRALTDWTRWQIGGVVGLAMCAGQAVAGMLRRHGRIGESVVSLLREVLGALPRGSRSVASRSRRIQVRHLNARLILGSNRQKLDLT